MFVVEQEDLALFLIRSAALGGFLAVIYLLGGFLRIPISRSESKKTSVILLFLPDLFFCLFSAFLNILLVFAANRGQIRIIALLLESVTFVGVIKLFNGIVYRLEYAVLRFFKRRVFLPCISPLRSLWKRVIRSLRVRAEYRKLRRFNKDLDAILLSVIDKNLLDAERAFCFDASKVGDFGAEKKKKRGLFKKLQTRSIVKNTLKMKEKEKRNGTNG